MPKAQALKNTAVIADDHALVRKGIADVLGRIAGLQIVGEAADGLEAITLVKSLQPNLLTLDTGMPLARGMEVFGEARRWSSATKVVVITGFTAAGMLADWIAAGVDGLFLKTCPPEEMHHGIELVLQGGQYYSKAVRANLERADEDTLTQRERQVLHLLAAGHTNQEIGARLSISPKTVDNHRTRLMAKLDVHSIAQLLAYALKEGLLDAETQR